MRSEDKLVDGRDLKLEEEELRAQDESLAWRGAERFELGFEQELAELPARVTTQHEDKDHRGLVLGAMRAILEGQKVVVALLRLPPRELIALEALQSAAQAKDSHLGQFVYATDRRDLLEQALGVLQPSLLTGELDLAELGGDFEAVTKRVGNLRTTLLQKEDAQDELIVGEEAIAKAETSASDDAANANASVDANVDANVTELDDPDELDPSPAKRSTLGHEDELPEPPSPPPSPPPSAPAKPGKKGNRG